jgi:hypothetical protein
MRTYTAAQREHKRLYDITYRAKTADRRRKKVAAYFKKHKTEIRIWLNNYQNHWRKTLRGRIAMRLSNAMRRQRIRTTKDGTVTRASVEKLYDGQKGCCALCPKKLTPK